MQRNFLRESNFSQMFVWLVVNKIKILGVNIYKSLIFWQYPPKYSDIRHLAPSIRKKNVIREIIAMKTTIKKNHLWRTSLKCTVKFITVNIQYDRNSICKCYQNKKKEIMLTDLVRIWLELKRKHITLNLEENMHHKYDFI